MKSKTLVGIIMLLLFCGTLSAAASDFTLGVFGNANEDDTINMQDVTYTELIILEYRDETELSDAKYDSKINMQDVTQIELIILGKEKELTIVDDYEQIATVNKPVTRVVLQDPYCVGAMPILGVQDLVVGVSNKITGYTHLPELSTLPDIGAYPPDLEAILDLNPDLVIGYPKYFESFPESIATVGIQFYKADRVVGGTKILGYIFGKRDEADYYIDEFHDKYIDLVREQTEELSEEERPKVYVECNKPCYTYGYTTGAHQSIELVGGTNIFADVEGMPTVDPEEIIMRNPDIIIRGAYSDSGYGVDDPAKIVELRDEIISRAGWDHITAVENGDVYVVDVDLHYGLDSPIGIAYWVKCRVMKRCVYLKLNRSHFCSVLVLGQKHRSR